MRFLLIHARVLLIAVLFSFCPITFAGHAQSAKPISKQKTQGSAKPASSPAITPKTEAITSRSEPEPASSDALGVPGYMVFGNGNVLARSVQGVVGSYLHQTTNATAGAANSFDGIKNAFASQLCTGPYGSMFGCYVEAEPTYEPQIGTVYPYRETALMPTGDAQLLLDKRGGSIHYYFHNPIQQYFSYRATTNFAVNCGLNRNSTVDQTAQSMGNYTSECFSPTQLVTVPGRNLGNKFGAGGWLVTKGMNLVIDSSAEGIHGGYGLQMDIKGLGDVNNYWYMNGWGGCRDASCESYQGKSMHFNEAATSYTGTLTSISGYNLITTPITDSGNQGVGRRMLNISEPITSGCITGSSQMTNIAGDTIPTTLFTIGCGGSVTASTAWGYVASDTSTVPYIPSSGSNTVTTSTVVTITLQHGSFSPGDWAVFTGDRLEIAKCTAAATAAGGSQVATFDLAENHHIGSLVLATPWGQGGLVLAANDANGQHYALDAVGALDATTLVVEQYFSSAENPVNMANMNLEQVTLNSPLINTGGTVRFNPNMNLGQQPVWTNYPLITIKNATNPSFNGTCTNLLQVANSGDLTCSQSASTGQTDPGATATISLGSTGYGNSQFTLYPAARVLDVQDYSTPDLARDGAFRLESFPTTHWTIGDIVEEPRDYTSNYVLEAEGMHVDNPYGQHAGITTGIDGYGANGYAYAFERQNGNPITMYQGGGGTMSVPPGFILDGPHSSFGGMNSMPFPSGTPFLFANCPPSGPEDWKAQWFNLTCENPNYSFEVFLGGSSTTLPLRLTWIPYIGQFMIDATSVRFPNMTTVTTGVMKYACFDSSNQLVAKATPCDAP